MHKPQIIQKHQNIHRVIIRHRNRDAICLQIGFREICRHGHFYRPDSSLFSSTSEGPSAAAADMSPLSDDLVGPE